MSTPELPYLAQGPLADAFAEHTKDFAFLYDRGAFAAWVGTRWSIGDPGDLLLKRAAKRGRGPSLAAEVQLPFVTLVRSCSHIPAGLEVII
jgi:hypothetical protein